MQLHHVCKDDFIILNARQYLTDMAQFKITMLILLFVLQGVQSINPHGIITELGQTVTMSATTRPGNELRWYKTNLNPENIIFDGAEVVHEYSKQFSAKTYDDGKADILIHNVTFANAGSYGYFDPFTHFEGIIHLVVVESFTLRLKRLKFRDNKVRYECALNYASDLHPEVIFTIQQIDSSSSIFYPHKDLDTNTTDSEIKSVMTVYLNMSPTVVTVITCQILFILSYPSWLRPVGTQLLQANLQEQFDDNFDDVSSLHAAYISGIFALIFINIVYVTIFWMIVFLKHKRNLKSETDYNQREATGIIIHDGMQNLRLPA